MLFLFVSLTFIATILYLPQHIAFIIDRAWFYVHGDTAGVPDMLAGSGNSGPPAQTTATYLKEL